MPEPVPQPAPPPGLLLDAVDRLADRFRSMPQTRLVASAEGQALSRAGEGLALAGRLAEAAQRLETPGRSPRRLPDAGVFAVGDQIAVAGHDLAAAVAARPAGDPEAVDAAEAALRDLTSTAGRL